jgi:hypothetical protein
MKTCRPSSRKYVLTGQAIYCIAAKRIIMERHPGSNTSVERYESSREDRSYSILPATLYNTTNERGFVIPRGTFSFVLPQTTTHFQSGSDPSRVTGFEGNRCDGNFILYFKVTLTFGPNYENLL